MRVEHVTDPADPRIAPYRDLPTHDRRHAGDIFVTESRQCVLQLLEGQHFRIRSVCCTRPVLAALLPALDRLDPLPDVLVADVPTLKAVTGFNFHRGCLAIAERGAPLAPETLLAGLNAGPGILVALDDVTDPDNVGAIFRNAIAFGVCGVLISANGGDPFYRKAIRVSVGATLRLPFARSTDLVADLARCRAAGMSCIALSPDGEPLGSVLRSLAPRDRVVLVAGAEDTGLRPAVRSAVDRVVAIPMAPGADSLNVATATGIALHRLADLG